MSSSPTQADCIGLVNFLVNQTNDKPMRQYIPWGSEWYGRLVYWFKWSMMNQLKGHGSGLLRLLTVLVYHTRRISQSTLDMKLLATVLLNLVTCQLTRASFRFSFLSKATNPGTVSGSTGHFCGILDADMKARIVLQQFLFSTSSRCCCECLLAPK